MKLSARLRRISKLTARAHAARGRRFERSGDWNGAAGAYEAAVARDGANPAFRRRLARALERAGRWPDAAGAYAGAITLGEPDPRVFVRLGRALERQRLWNEAADAYRAAIALDGSRAKWHFRLGRALARGRQWEAAAAAFEAALALDDTRPGWGMRLGVCFERAGHKDHAEAAYRTAMARDPATIRVEQELLAADVHRFVPRRRVAHFVSEHLNEIRTRARGERYRSEGCPRRIWIYWAQGIHSAPAVVRRCHEELMRLHTSDEVVALDDSLVPHYVDIPDIVLRRTRHDKTKFSDVLRLELLARYGGIWMDATCLPRQRLFEPLADLLTSGFFAFRYRDARISSWLLASEPNHPIVELLRQAQYVYWERHKRPLDYYLIHHLFEALYYLDEDFRQRYDSTPNASSHLPSRFARVMHEPYDPEVYEAMMNAYWVHKLSTRSKAAQMSADSHLAHFVRGDVTR